MFFEKKIDLRSKEAMQSFLTGHFRYDTMNSWNQATSYAHCVKLPRLGLTRAQEDKAYELLGMEEVTGMCQSLIDDFTAEQAGEYTMGFNGRSQGYLVLYKSHYESTGHQSRCRRCGQLNFRKVFTGELSGPKGVVAKELLRSDAAWTTATYLNQPAIQALGLPSTEATQLINELRPQCQGASATNQCGNCQAVGDLGRVNLKQSPRQLSVALGRGIDQYVTWSEVNMEELRRKVRVVQAFDRACDQIRDTFIEMLEDYIVVKKTVMVPKTVQVLEKAIP